MFPNWDRNFTSNNQGPLRTNNQYRHDPNNSHLHPHSMYQYLNDSEDLIAETSQLDKPEFSNQTKEFYPRHDQVQHLDNHQRRTPDPVFVKQYYKENMQFPTQKEFQNYSGKISPSPIMHRPMKPPSRGNNHTQEHDRYKTPKRITQSVQLKSSPGANNHSGLLSQTPEPISNHKRYQYLDNEAIYRATNRISKKIYGLGLLDQHHRTRTRNQFISQFYARFNRLDRSADHSPDISYDVDRKLARREPQAHQKIERESILKQQQYRDNINYPLSGESIFEHYNSNNLNKELPYIHEFKPIEASRYIEERDDDHSLVDFDQIEGSLQPEGQPHKLFEKQHENYEQDSEDRIVYKQDYSYDKNPDGFDTSPVQKTAYLNQHRPVSKVANPNLMQYNMKNQHVLDTQNLEVAQKLEYRRILELQILEKQLKKSHEDEIRKLEYQLEQLEEQTDQMKMELDKDFTFNHINKRNVGSYGPEEENLLRYSQKALEYQSMKDNSRRSMPECLILQQEVLKLREEFRANSLLLQNQISELRRSTENQPRLGRHHYQEQMTYGALSTQLKNTRDGKRGNIEYPIPFTSNTRRYGSTGRYDEIHGIKQRNESKTPLFYRGEPRASTIRQFRQNAAGKRLAPAKLHPKNNPIKEADKIFDLTQPMNQTNEFKTNFQIANELRDSKNDKFSAFIEEENRKLPENRN